MPSRHLRLRHTLPALLLILALSLPACARPKIDRFDAAPRRLCRDQTTTLSWAVKGTPVLSADPPVAGTGPVDPEGSLTVSPEVSTVFTLRVERGGKSARANQEVVVYATSPEVPVVIDSEPGPDGGLVAATAVPAADWDDGLRIALVSNDADRPLTVRHGGREAVLASGETSDALAGLVMSGSWELAAGLLPGEVMGDPAHAPPDRLRLRVALDCGR